MKKRKEPNEMANNLQFQTTVLSVSKNAFTGDDGKYVEMWRLYVCDPGGDVGAVYSRTPYAVGDIVTLTIRASQGKIKIALVKPALSDVPPPDDDLPFEA